ncbi:L-amino acid N-acyltransferase YncA [Pseudoduganella lurida]|uniref:L-amino acid N-acyltransferase YncA n=1 Tax=Pseudoduganella lurida TaxID=1036180 RepID=A0A562RGC7_9BURK|nr:GNAT family N-acetyltransferase [Pseudoduganella lurida]TWI67624.1 L-amino acid N-acyltransferase YncA [Pseudoduganella lurida]
MHFDIRPATPADAAAACQVLRRTIAESCTQDHQDDPAILDAWLGNKHPPMVAAWFESSTNYSLVVLHGDAVVGVSLLTAAGKLALCYVLPEAQRQGAGRALLQRVEEHALAVGIRTIHLHSTAAADPFFAALGYRRDGNVRSPYGVDTMLFWKPLVAGAEPDAKRKRFCNCNSN